MRASFMRSSAVIHRLAPLGHATGRGLVLPEHGGGVGRYGRHGLAVTNPLLIHTPWVLWAMPLLPLAVALACLWMAWVNLNGCVWKPGASWVDTTMMREAGLTMNAHERLSLLMRQLPARPCSIQGHPGRGVSKHITPLLPKWLL